MRELVTHGVRDLLLECNRRRLFVKQEGDVTVGDEPPVLHSTSLKVWNRYKVHLRQWVGDTKDLRKVLERLRAHAQSETALFQHSRESIDAHLDGGAVVLTSGVSLDVLEGTDNEGNKLMEIHMYNFMF